MQQQHLIFVYGTLKRDNRNHRILKDSMFVGDATTVPKFTMYSNGVFPALLSTPQFHIKGEVYSVSTDMLNRLDCFEGYNKTRGHNLYERGTVDVIFNNTQKQMTNVFFYYQTCLSSGMQKVNTDSFHPV
jgi:gamma-glutamylcyclotransferase (GGCT)/AIG2-like uncharacterized protein YtfP